jgi:hypothetical protein
MGGQMETPARGQAQPGQDGRYAIAAGIPEIARATATRQNHGTLYRVTPTVGEPFTISVKGRVHWALDRLRAAGAKGCTPIAEPAPRWSAYVCSLRQLGVEIETLHEPHGGEFSGHHGRYILRSRVNPVGMVAA